MVGQVHELVDQIWFVEIARQGTQLLVGGETATTGRDIGAGGNDTKEFGEDLEASRIAHHVHNQSIGQVLLVSEPMEGQD